MRNGTSIGLVVLLLIVLAASVTQLSQVAG
ncbi:MAG: hypothetical protein ACI970_001610 [Myxococcota bacterium]|jgi:hypothetical protein